MSDFAEGSENDLEEGILEEPEEDSNEDSRENCEENNSSSCSKSSVSLSEDKNSSEEASAEESSSTSSRIIFEIPPDVCGHNDQVQNASDHNRKVISFTISGSFFHLIPGSDEDISCRSYSRFLQCSKEVPRNNTSIAKDENNFLFVYRGSEDDLKGRFTRRSAGSDTSQESVISLGGIFASPHMSEEHLMQNNAYVIPPPPPPPSPPSTDSSESSKSNIIKKEIPESSKNRTVLNKKDLEIALSKIALDVQDSQDRFSTTTPANSEEPITVAESAGSSKDIGTVIGKEDSKVAITHDMQDSEETIAIVEQSLLEEIEDCLQKYFAATSSEEEKFERKLSQLICKEPLTSSEELSLEEASKESLDVENCNICSDSNSESSDSESEEHQEQLKVCLKQGCTNISCKKKKKVFFLCNFEDFQQLLKEEEGEEDICNKDDSEENKYLRKRL